MADGLKVIYLFIYLLLAALGLCCCLQVSHCSGFSCCGAWALSHEGSPIEGFLNYL